jgi:hypothetical protein
MEFDYLSRQERQFYGWLLASVNDRTYEVWQSFAILRAAIIMSAKLAVGYICCDGCPTW